MVLNNDLANGLRFGEKLNRQDLVCVLETLNIIVFREVDTRIS